MTKLFMLVILYDHILNTGQVHHVHLNHGMNLELPEHVPDPFIESPGPLKGILVSDTRLILQLKLNLLDSREECAIEGQVLKRHCRSRIPCIRVSVFTLS